MTGSRVILGDCVEAMAAMEPCSVDAVVCDPPYELGFMGKSWDNRGVAFDPATWQAAFRVLKPGGHLLAFGGTRTFHRIAVAIEDAGFEIRDCLSWMYGSGFPKSLDVSKAIDKAAGAEREIVGVKHAERYPNGPGGNTFTVGGDPDGSRAGPQPLTAPATPDAAAWQGWGTALKPAWEPIIVARKPLIGTVAANVLEHGTGAINVDGCRVAVGGERISVPQSDPAQRSGVVGADLGITLASRERFQEAQRESVARTQALGRWPANVVLSHTEDCVAVGANVKTPMGTRGADADDHVYALGRATSGQEVGYGDADGLETVEAWECAPDCPVRMLDEQSGTLKSGKLGVGTPKQNAVYGKFAAANVSEFEANQGGASRFFYCAKASRAERNAGLEGFADRLASSMSGRRDADDMSDFKLDNDVTSRFVTAKKNHHPTVKPVEVMRWLLRLVTPPGGTVLDPFTGSGTTGIAATLEGFDFVGCEQDAEYVQIAEARISWWAEHGEDAIKADRAARAEKPPEQPPLPPEDEQLGLSF